MTVQTPGQPRVFLSILAAGPAERRIAVGVALASLAAFGIALPFAKIQLAAVPAFIPVYESALFINDFITAILLFGQFSILRSRALLLLGCAYTFTGLMVVMHMLSFPGLFADEGLLGAGRQTTAWLYMFWHSGFPLLVIAYALQPRPGDSGDVITLAPRRAIAGGVALVALAVALITLLTTTGQALLPVIMDGNHYTPVLKFVVITTWLSSVPAIAVLWRRKPHSVLDLWLMVVLVAWLCDIGLAALFNQGRFDLGFYAGRIFGFAATGFVMLVLLLETRALYARLAQSIEAERVSLAEANAALRDREQQLEILNDTLEQRVRERTAQLEAETAAREKVQETLRETQKMEAIGRMAGGIAHDFNNLLTIIVGNAEILHSDVQDEGSRHAIQGIDQAADRGAKLVRQILTFSRRQAVNPEVIDLHHRANDLREMLDRSVRGDVRLMLSLAPDLWPIHCDAAELEIALMNLCVNARDAMPKGGLVHIEARNHSFLSPTDSAAGVTGDFITISVMDSGTGIAPDNVQHIFEPFFTTKELGKGTGLGLSQVYGFTQQAGGVATVASTVGKGTTVTLYLPRAKLAAPAPSLVTRELAAPGSGTILLVEDDDAVATIAKRMLMRIGYQVEHVSDGATALALLLSGQKFDILFSDIIMPGNMNGLDLARSVRQHFPRLPILLTSGYAKSAAEVYRDGFNIIAKPYDTDSLAEALRRTATEMREAIRNERDLA